jgi:hypothetical protein
MHDHDHDPARRRLLAQTAALLLLLALPPLAGPAAARPPPGRRRQARKTFTTRIAPTRASVAPIACNSFRRRRDRRWAPARSSRA